MLIHPSMSSFLLLFYEAAARARSMLSAEPPGSATAPQDRYSCGVTQQCRHPPAWAAQSQRRHKSQAAWGASSAPAMTPGRAGIPPQHGSHAQPRGPASHCPSSLSPAGNLQSLPAKVSPPSSQEPPASDPRICFPSSQPRSSAHGRSEEGRQLPAGAESPRLSPACLQHKRGDKLGKGGADACP